MSAFHKGRDAVPAFSQLPRREQSLLLPKLLGIVPRQEFPLATYEQAAQRLHTLIHLENLAHPAIDKFLTLQNFTRQLCQLPVAWGQLHKFIGVSCSYLEVTVYNHQEFLTALKKAGFAVNSWMEKISRLAGHGHRFDSARARTEHRYEPQLHLVNDRADEAAYGPNYFFVHWDAQSVYARRAGLFSRIAAGRTHKHHTASPQDVRAYLDRREDGHKQKPVIWDE